MGIREIERELRASGEKAIAAINSDASKQMADIRKDIEKSAEAELKKLEASRKNETELERKRILSKAGLQIREKIESMKAGIVERVFSEASAAVEKLSDREKAKILRSLADEAKKGLEKPEIFVDRKYAKLLKGAKPADIGDFGVRVVSGHITVDNTLSAKMNEIKSNLRHKVVDVLWPQ
ncbi:MAG: hypothetical protein J7K54_03785 [Candidatus Aenigmarchaeota archaeon]|nr:hypothetical protein [Candidatus Aenigmarchaeota archaeon]